MPCCWTSGACVKVPIGGCWMLGVGWCGIIQLHGVPLRNGSFPNGHWMVRRYHHHHGYVDGNSHGMMFFQLAVMTGC